MRKNLCFNDQMFCSRSFIKNEQKFNKWVQTKTEHWGKDFQYRIISNYEKVLDGVKYYFKVVEYCVEY